MAKVYLIAAPGDTGAGDALADWLRRRGFIVRTDYGRFQYPPLQPGEVLVMLWSRTALMSVKQMFLVNRAIDAWEWGRLVLAKLDHGLKPRGLGDVEMIDLAFAPAREHRYINVARAVREIAAPAPPPASSRPAAPAPSAPGVRRVPGQDPSPAPVPAQGDGAGHDDLDGLFGSDEEATQEEEQARAPQLFVSYASADRETAWPIVERVEELGVEVWIDRDDLRPGQAWAGAIVRAIKSVAKVCLMCSAESFRSDHVRREIYLADKYKKALVPVRLDGAEMPEDFEYFLIDRQWLDAARLTGPEGEAVLREVFGG